MRKSTKRGKYDLTKFNKEIERQESRRVSVHRVASESLSSKSSIGLDTGHSSRSSRSDGRSSFAASTVDNSSNAKNTVLISSNTVLPRRQPSKIPQKVAGSPPTKADISLSNSKESSVKTPARQKKNAAPSLNRDADNEVITTRSWDEFERQHGLSEGLEDAATHLEQVQGISKVISHRDSSQQPSETSSINASTTYSDTVDGNINHHGRDVGLIASTTAVVHRRDSSTISSSSSSSESDKIEEAHKHKSKTPVNNSYLTMTQNNSNVPKTPNTSTSRSSPKHDRARSNSSKSTSSEESSGGENIKPTRSQPVQQSKHKTGVNENSTSKHEKPKQVVEKEEQKSAEVRTSDNSILNHNQKHKMYISSKLSTVSSADSDSDKEPERPDGSRDMTDVIVLASVAATASSEPQGPADELRTETEETGRVNNGELVSGDRDAIDVDNHSETGRYEEELSQGLVTRN